VYLRQVIINFGGQFYCWRQPEYQRKPPTCCKLLTNLSHNVVSSIARHKRPCSQNGWQPLLDRYTCSYLHHEQFKTLCVNNMSCPLLVFYFVSMILWIWRDLTLSCSSWNFSHITKLQSRHSNLISIVCENRRWHQKTYFFFICIYALCTLCLFLCAPCIC
jgi:hypothetical protein